MTPAAPDADKYMRLVEEWRTICAGAAAELLDGARLEAMRQVQFRIAATGGWTQGPSTLMDVLGVTRNEVMNCRVLRWLLDPLGRHGIGAPFLAALAEALDLDLDGFDHARVEAEVSGALSRADVSSPGRVAAGLGFSKPRSTPPRGPSRVAASRRTGRSQARSSS